MVEFSSLSMVNLVFGCRLLMCWKNCVAEPLKKQYISKHCGNLSKIVYVAIMVVVPERIFEKFESIHKNFI